ncbi:hypothetical protein [Bacillus sp. m3-13]|uniref:hypothetical protein n=1 Tax=Bacillus sp. m3-13 TaxID=406124 RepID=UPI0001E89DF2|nr:hypothetical protein [Bacillus sp. m3-13]
MISFNQALLISPSATYGKKATPKVIVEEKRKGKQNQSLEIVELYYARLLPPFTLV